ncbi:transposase (plasmid) [Cupriavidus taiwanensis]|uniref:Putative transposase n=1 Tax=Cupriavidus taiwanensis TaxID=164546 RepID=A0A7Z7JDX0_9BURK|nr:putative transposase fragment [Cupriavidus taiwanensis]SOZ09013.1 putative transposase fragment [Cupriavidus taiwanensis]SOZ11258.1 putative transposase fragment [Cupriavidus taiwanensis]SOZ42610.1 putative transposase fragment [Cupriavidus taiwanensis]SPC21660.1 putative transposase fragment [Cupriavidus taiwanensis]
MFGGENGVPADRGASIPEDLIAHFVKGPMTAGAVQDASMAFKKALIERGAGR